MQEWLCLVDKKETYRPEMKGAQMQCTGMAIGRLDSDIQKPPNG